MRPLGSFLHVIFLLPVMLTSEFFTSLGQLGAGDLILTEVLNTAGSGRMNKNTSRKQAQARPIQPKPEQSSPSLSNPAQARAIQPKPEQSSHTAASFVSGSDLYCQN